MENQEVLELFYGILCKMKKEWNQRLREMTPSQYLILKTLKKSGPQKAADLAEATHISPGAVTGATDKLVAEGLARRKGAEDDRRVVYLEITNSGQQLVDTLLEEQKKMSARLFEGLPDEDIRHLLRIYRLIAQNLSGRDSRADHKQ